MSGETKKWDAKAYDGVAAPVEEWGRAVLDRLELSGDEVVLDVGCGSGVVTELIAERAPNGRVIGVDASEEMIEAARERLGDRAELHTADVLEFELPEPVDVIFSNAAFHWIGEQEELYEKLSELLKPGGRLEAQCGGIGNIAEVDRVVDAANGAEPFGPYLRGRRRPWTFPRPSDTDLRLERAGFAKHRTWLEDAQVEPKDPRTYLATVILRAHLDALPDELQDAFLDYVLGGMPRPFVLDYVRLNVSATR
ncbi:MAG: class I SAM-dependent methyltransferase [Solirubrobacterales bacterium]